MALSLHIDKKQKLESESESESEETESEPDWDDEYRQDITADIALEIGLRQRLADTLEARIAWATLLQESLLNDTSDAVPQILDFKDVALDALAAIEAPAEILFARDEPAPRLDTRRLSFAKKPRKKPTARAPAAPKKGGKFLYIHLEGSAAPRILRCPVCLRTEFGSLQGLFNHARGTHSLAWTTHDECVRQCACALDAVQGGAVDFADLDAGAEVGSGGILPGLRSLFERAVGDEALDFGGETVLSRSLGYHVDTPALASFLGRAPIRRGVVVWDPEAVVDVDGLDVEKPRAKPRWRMPFAHRNVYKDAPAPPASAASPVERAASPPPRTNAAAPANANTAPGLPTTSSRFHIASRIVVVDRSLWIPLDHRIGGDTHKWMVSVDAPSYTHHITTVLQSLTVTAPAGLLLTAAPPFVVIGTAAAPFLARLELAFYSPSVGGPPQKIVLEHWVELDRMQSSSVAVGEEQIVDVELDRGTLFRSAQSGYLPVNARALWDMDLESERHTPIAVAPEVAPPTEIPVRGSAKDERKTRNALPRVKILGGWQTVLKKLVERFPLTLRDVKGGKPPVPALPYKLVATPAQFSSLVMGRKKAIEWGRAMAIRDAYSDAVLNGLTEDTTVLTTADIFSWLHTNGHFPRAVATLKKEQDLQILKTGFCRICGLAYRLHAIVSDSPQTSIKSEPRPNLAVTGVGDAFVCHITPIDWHLKRMPMIDLTRIFPRRHALAPSSTMLPLNTTLSGQAAGDDRHSGWDSRAPALLAVSDPRLISGVRALVSALKLPAFAPPSPLPASSPGLPQFPINPALSPADIKADVAPYALLALLTKQFVRTLVKTGLEVAGQDRQRAMLQVDGRARRLPNIAELFSERERRMLTPTHILRGVIARGRDYNDRLGMAMMSWAERSAVAAAAAATAAADRSGWQQWTCCRRRW
ncbi:hypothetical protein B0H17DRAFT_1201138 [Mycena rosella]|uniref:YEATS domain-containing protein n=1 Tax=Mycena rosella TaxID=1033263 RepID=A0AAD7DHA7_MYCRO|nr:hypothetical protein B0H17DRAFT_1201138 [Mycena rosella]